MTTPASADEPFSTWMEAAGRAATSLSSGDPQEALAASREAAAITTGEARARALLLSARALEMERRPAEAAVDLESALPLLPKQLHPAVRARMAADLTSSGRPADAAGAWALAASSADEADRPSFAAAEAEAWIAAGEPRKAARAALPAVAAGLAPARLAQARAWIALGDARGAPALRAIALEHPGEPESEGAVLTLQELSPASLSVSDRLERTRRMLVSGRSAEALLELEVVEHSLGATPHTSLLRSLALLRTGRTEEAERIAAPIARLPGTVGEPAAARYVLARTAARQGRTDEAVSLYARVARERPTVPGLGSTQQADLPDDAAYLAAWMPYDAGRTGESIVALRRFLRDHPGAKRASDARWFLARALLRSGDEAAAGTAFRDVAERESGGIRAAALYWLARTQTDPARAAAYYREAAAEVPGGWYALLARTRLEKLGLPGTGAEAPVSPLSPPDPPRDATLAAALSLAVDLAGAGLPEEAGAILRRLSRPSELRGRAVHLAEVAAFIGDAEVPHHMAREHLPQGIRTLRWAYPDALPPVIGPSARALGLDPSLVLAVMRRESAFVSTARSGAAAEGLLQLRPSTAHRTAAVLGIADEGSLADGAGNARLGMAYLALLGDRFPTTPQALAAYNAGPAAAATWSRSRPGRPLDEWVEDIPFRETRHYVRNVIADWARYRWLRGDGPPPIDPDAIVNAAGEGVAF